MNRPMKAVVLVALFGAAGSCGYAMPYQSSGPSMSKQRVQFAILGESCYVNRSAEQWPTTVDDDELNLGLRLQVKNEATQVVALSPDRFRLSEKIGGERLTMQPRESQSVGLQPGETKVLSLDFAQRGGLDCHHEMALEAQGAVAIGNAQVEFEPIRFLASE